MCAKFYIYTIISNTKEVIRSRKSKKNRQSNNQKKNDKNANCKTPHIKLKIEQYEHN
jgi:hypothetical protein